MDSQKFKIAVDGVEKDATVIRVIELEGKEYAIYSIDNGNDTSDIFASEVIKDEEGYDKLVDITDPSAHAKVAEYIEKMFS